MKKETLGNATLLGSALLSALATTMCCWGPVLLMGIAGASSAASVFAWVEPARPYLFVLAFLSLGLAFHRVYRQEPTQAGGSCPKCKARQKKRAIQKFALWLVAGFAAVLFVFTYLIFPLIL